MKGTAVLIVIILCATVIPVMTAHQAVTIVHVAFMSVFSVILVTGAAIDMHYYILPDEGALVLAVTGLLFGYMENHDPLESVVGVLSAVFVSYALRYISKNGFGWGDIKWLGAVALWLNPMQIIAMFCVAFWSGSLYLLGFGRLHRNRRIPFGPFICFGAWLSLYYFDYLEAVYWNMENHTVYLLKGLF